MNNNSVNNASKLIHTEAKMLEDIAPQLGYNAKTVDTSITGNVYLITERAPCASCSDVIKQFEQMFPNVNVVVKYTK
ncbi:deaminase domain-containing protein [Bacillus aquiflavi]